MPFGFCANQIFQSIRASRRHELNSKYLRELRYTNPETNQQTLLFKEMANETVDGNDAMFFTPAAALASEIQTIESREDFIKWFANQSERRIGLIESLCDVFDD